MGRAIRVVGVGRAIWCTGVSGTIRIARMIR